RLPCAAHTLQLSINHAFKKKHHQIQRIQSLVKFFDSPKQSQRLDNAQVEKCKNKQRNLSDSNLTLSDNSDYEGSSEDEDEITTGCEDDEILNFDSESESEDDDLRQLISPSEEHSISSNPTNISSNNMFKNIIFGKSQRSRESMDELDYYLDFRRTP
ncbi:21984_t:CDS:2, partial [Gigaspora margarita]